MKVGTALNMLCQPGRSDASVVGEHLAIGDLAEPLGFDSLFALEHHFTGYAMSPAPLELLAYYAGRTKRIVLGTAVIVLPWHDPIRVAEGIALLDILSGGRCLFGFGRGAANVEYEGFRIPMEEARPRFAEAAQLIRKALREHEFEWQGEFYQIPRTSIRPRPISHPEERFFASSVSPESAEIMAKLGFGILVVMQNEWPKAAENIVSYREIALSVGHNPPPPIILTNVSCAESRDEAHDRAMNWLGKKWQSIDNHYHFSDGHLATVKGYESYGKMAKTYARLQIEAQIGARRIGRQPIARALLAGRVPQAREVAQIGERFVEQLQPVAPADMPRVQGDVEVTAALVLRIEFRLPVPRQGVGMLETGALAGKHQKELIVEMVVIGQRQQRPPAGKVGDPVMRYVVGQAVPHIGVPGIEQQIHRVRA